MLRLIVPSFHNVIGLIRYLVSVIWGNGERYGEVIAALAQRPRPGCPSVVHQCLPALHVSDSFVLFPVFFSVLVEVFPVRTFLIVFSS